MSFMLLPCKIRTKGTSQITPMPDMLCIQNRANDPRLPLTNATYIAAARNGHLQVARTYGSGVRCVILDTEQQVGESLPDPISSGSFSLVVALLGS